MDNLPEDALEKGRRTAVLIGCFIIMSVFVYAAIVEYFTRSQAPFAGFSHLPADMFDKLRMILAGVCVVDLALIPFLRNRVLLAPNRAGTPLAGRLLSAMTISFALCESIVICGFVLFLTNGARREFYMFLFVSLLAFFVHFPGRERWQEWARKVKDATGQGE